MLADVVTRVDQRMHRSSIYKSRSSVHKSRSSVPVDVQELLVLTSGPGGAAPVPFRWRTWRSAGRRGSVDRRGPGAAAGGGEADRRGSTGRRPEGICWPPRRRARQGERRPERETPTGGESGGRRGAGGPRGRGAERGEPEGAMGFAAASLGLGVGDSGTRGPGWVSP